jgi:hypothetical protein
LCINLLALPVSALAQTTQNYYPPDVLDKPLGITRLPNGNTLITDGGGANYTTTDAAILEVDPAAQVVWLYDGPMAFAHSANPWPDGTILITDTGNDRVFRVNRDGQVVWTSEDWGGGTGLLSDGSHLDYPNDAEWLPNGHLLLSDRNNDRVLEVTESGEVVWVYDRLVRPHNPDRLANGNTMVSDSERNTVIEVNPAGEIIWQFGGDGILDWPRDADRLEDGNTLVTDSRHNRVIEVTAAGDIIWEYGGLSIPYEADRLPNGNTLISDNNHKRVIEVNPAGEIVWSFRNIPDEYPATLQNGGFELDADGDGLPDGWFPADLNAEGPATFLWDGTVKRSGRRSAGLEYHGPGRVAWLQTVTVTPGKTYRFEGDIKTNLIGGVAAYQIWFLDDLGGPIGEPTTVKAHTASEGWTRDRLDVTAPADAAAVQIWALSMADGSVWFDNVRFGPPGRASLLLWGGLGALGLVVVAGGVYVVARRRPRGTST